MQDIMMWGPDADASTYMRAASLWGTPNTMGPAAGIMIGKCGPGARLKPRHTRLYWQHNNSCF